MATKYTARVLENIDNGKGFWNYQKIGVFRNEGDKEEKVGEYVRNYGSFMETFHHFTLNGKDLAIFSPHYTCTRIMSLPDCKDIGGEPDEANGFCPTGYYVPSYADFEMISNYRAGQKVEPHPVKFRVDEPDEASLKKPTEYVDKEDSRRLTDRLYYPFGFVSGCIWGDDTSWKIEFLDLSRADKGILVREQRFGYIELPGELKLKQAIRISGDPDHEPSIRIATESYYDFKTGKKNE